MKQKALRTGDKLLLVAFGLVCTTGLASAVHPFGRVRNAVSAAPLLEGASVPPGVMEIVTKACQNCHSEKTEWPIYSRVAPMSWMMEKDVRDARSHMNLSRWSFYDSNQREELLSEVGSLVRNHRMPLPRYLLLHPEARLSDSEVENFYRWTRSERKRLKASELPPATSAETNPDGSHVRNDKIDRSTNSTGRPASFMPGIAVPEPLHEDVRRTPQSGIPLSN